MKYKTIYNTLACMLVACGSANASSLMDDSEKARSEEDFSTSRMMVRNSSANLEFTVTLNNSSLGQSALTMQPGESKRIEDFYPGAGQTMQRYYGLTIECNVQDTKFVHSRDWVELNTLIALLGQKKYVFAEDFARCADLIPFSKNKLT